MFWRLLVYRDCFYIQTSYRKILNFTCFHIWNSLSYVCFDYRPTPCISANAPYGGGGAGITVEGYGSFGSGGYGGGSSNNQESGCVLLEFWFQ